MTSNFVLNYLSFNERYSHILKANFELMLGYKHRVSFAQHGRFKIEKNVFRSMVKLSTSL